MNRKSVALIAVIVSLIFVGCSNNTNAQRSPEQSTTTQTIQVAKKTQISQPQNDPWANINPTKVNRITTEQFKQLVFDYTKSQVWQYKGKKPCVIDFYADWCRPCHFVSPIMEQLAQEYNGKIYFYKVNVDYERELAQVFGIRNIPSVLFCPVQGQPQIAVGAMQKQNYVKAIYQIMGIKHPTLGIGN